jgi:hypothetical protein
MSTTNPHGLIAKSLFKVGDTVKVLRKPAKNDPRAEIWVSGGMEHLVGLSGTVVSVAEKSELCVMFAQ